MAAGGIERAGRILLGVFGVGFILIGLRYFADPALLTAESDVAMPSVKAVMEIRTVYGGMFVGVGLNILVMALRRAMLVSGLWALVIIAGSVAIGRVAAIALGQAPDTLFAALLATEVVGVALALIILRALVRRA